MANAAGATVWRWDQQEPFGVNVPDENPSGLGAFEFPMRFPGQYFDKETNLAYNMMRDFDSSIGRYLETDPIGLRGGLNVYAYVGADPIGASDELGLRRGGSRSWCGTGWTEAFTWENPGGPSFSGPCRNHDKCWDVCGNDKLACDDNFYQDMKNVCQALSGDALRKCLESAFFYYNMVLQFGDGPYRRAQEAACKKCNKK